MHHKKLIPIGCAMVTIIMKTMYLVIVQYFNNTIVHKDKNLFELTYTVGGSMYKMLIRVKRGPRKLIYAFDQDGKDVTDLLQMYLGPNDDFHHVTFTPDYFDKETITVNLNDGTEHTFSRFQAILVKY